jgi:hypothetical protein
VTGAQTPPIVVTFKAAGEHGRGVGPGQRTPSPWSAATREATAAADPSPLGESRRWPGQGPDDQVLELIAGMELDRLRRTYNQRVNGAWGILYDPATRLWTGVRGRTRQITTETPAALEDWIRSGLRGP